MSDRILISFKENETDLELYNFLKEQSKVIGASAYIKQILYEKMLKEKKAIN